MKKFDAKKGKPAHLVDITQGAYIGKDDSMYLPLNKLNP